MLPFQDAPYQFFPPRPNTLIAALARWVNRHVALPGRGHLIKSLEISGAEHLRIFAARRDIRLLFVPNHPTHSDPQVITEVLRRCGLKTAFMAAYDVFLRSGMQAWIMQRCGSFSVDRDASDTQSLKTAINVLAGGRHALTIFPEGNVHLTNDRPAPYLDGAAFIALRAQKQLEDTAEVFAVPVAIKATHLSDPSNSVHELVRQIAGDLGSNFDSTAPLQEVRRLGMMAVERNLQQRGHPAPHSGEDLGEYVNRCAELILTGLEGKMKLVAKEKASLPERARKARAAIHEVRSDPGRKIDHSAAASWADEAMLVLRLLGYGGNYLAEGPTLDRYAETVERLAEDLYSHPRLPFGPRHVFATIMRPISVREWLASGARSRTATQDLTKSFQSATAEALRAINAQNPHPGSRQMQS